MGYISTLTYYLLLRAQLLYCLTLQNDVLLLLGSKIMGFGFWLKTLNLSATFRPLLYFRNILGAFTCSGAEPRHVSQR